LRKLSLAIHSQTKSQASSRSGNDITFLQFPVSSF
jgi:hypothetical protein